MTARLEQLLILIFMATPQAAELLARIFIKYRGNSSILT